MHACICATVILQTGARPYDSPDYNGDGGCRARMAIRRIRCSRSATVALFAAVTIAGSFTRVARAQTPLVGDSVHAAKTLFTWRDAALAGAFTALTVSMFPTDRALAAHLQDSTTQANRFFKNASKGIQYVADPGSIVIGVSLFAIGKVSGWRDVADLGLHGTEAIVVASSFTAALKGVAGRARPYVSRDTNPRAFKLNRGFGNGGLSVVPVRAHDRGVRRRFDGHERIAALVAERRLVRCADHVRRRHARWTLSHVQQRTLGKRCRARRGHRHVRRHQSRALQPRSFQQFHRSCVARARSQTDRRHPRDGRLVHRTMTFESTRHEP